MELNDLPQIKIWSIFVIHYGVKLFVTKIDNINHIHEMAKTKCSNKEVMKFGRDEAIAIIKANDAGKYHTYGITATNGVSLVVSQSIYKKAKNRNITVDEYYKWYGRPKT